MFGIFLGLALLILLAYRGYSIIWIAPVCSLVVALTGGLELLPSYTSTYMAGFVGFTESWFPVFMLGSIFGKIMEDTGAAKSIATELTYRIGKKQAILAIVLGCAVLTYGGISLFVVVFAMYPMAIAVYREANIPRRLIPGAIALGAFGFTMTAVPGTPQIQNLIPMKYFGTTPMAAPIMGLAATAVIFGGGYMYLLWKQRKLIALGEVFTEPPASERVEESEYNPNPYLSILPLIVVILALNVFKLHIVASLSIGILLAMILNFRCYKQFTGTLSSGASASVMAIINTSAAVGFGTVVKEVPGFQELTNILLGIQGSPLISEAIAVNILAGATGSASGGMGIALEALGAKYMDLATQMNINPEAFHRIASLSSGGLDTLPHNGAVLTLLAASHMSHKESYIDIFVTCTAIPVLAVIVAIIMGSFGIV